MDPKMPTKQKHGTRNALLWMFSGFIVLIGMALVQTVVHLLLPAPTNPPQSLSADAIMKVLNILSAFGGMIGVILIPVGLVVGIVKLSRH